MKQVGFEDVGEQPAMAIIQHESLEKIELSDEGGSSFDIDEIQESPVKSFTETSSQYTESVHVKNRNGRSISVRNMLDLSKKKAIRYLSDIPMLKDVTA